MSLGGGASSALDTAVTNSIADGVTFGVAAGNENTNACNGSPARVPSALTVGATTSTDARASYSNYGTCLDLFAPGSSITSAWYTCEHGDQHDQRHVDGDAARRRRRGGLPAEQPWRDPGGRRFGDHRRRDDGRRDESRQRIGQPAPVLAPRRDHDADPDADGHPDPAGAAAERATPARCRVALRRSSRTAPTISRRSAAPIRAASSVPPAPTSTSTWTSGTARPGSRFAAARRRTRTRTSATAAPRATTAGAWSPTAAPAPTRWGSSSRKRGTARPRSPSGPIWIR